MGSTTHDRQAPARDGEQLGDALWEVTAYAELMGEAMLAGTPLTLSSSGMLQTVAGEPGITVAEMSRRIPKTQQAISQVAARLQKLGFIERRVGPGRGVGLYVTESGAEMAAEARRAEAVADRRLRSLLGDKRHGALLALLIESRAILRREAR